MTLPGKVRRNPAAQFVQPFPSPGQLHQGMAVTRDGIQIAAQGDQRVVAAFAPAIQTGDARARAFRLATAEMPEQAPPYRSKPETRRHPAAAAENPSIDPQNRSRACHSPRQYNAYNSTPHSRFARAP